MTRPRFGGVTNWMNGFDDMIGAQAGINVMQNALADCIGGIKGAAVGSSFTAKIADCVKLPAHLHNDIKITYSEVNHRPAGWQQPVCTP